MSTLAELRSRALPFAPRLASAAPEVRLLGRLLGVMLFVTSALSVHLWTRMQVNDTAIRLDRARGALVRAQTDRDRLLVERTMLRSPGRLGAIAVGLDLAAPESVVDVGIPVSSPPAGAP